FPYENALQAYSEFSFPSVYLKGIITGRFATGFVRHLFYKIQCCSRQDFIQLYRHVLFFGCSAIAGDCRTSAKTRPHPGFKFEAASFSIVIFNKLL
ncbi:hypothetical protein, partial [Ligilactobacillus ruminis]|uniref:hypothetical protein n=1 Tax=Ligilactobacillus ruminis TaxID=1623 RepID=UPI0034A12A3F